MSLPQTWKQARLAELTCINPPNPDELPSDSTLVSFVPMAAVEEMTGRLDATQARLWAEVRKGYTRFQEGDVVLAKITPSMENGKAALAIGLIGGVGAGTTEFHVFRPEPGIEARLVLHFVLQESFRRQARARMTGTAGQLRVPTEFLVEQFLPVPPSGEQQRIVEAIDSYLSRLDAAAASLARVQAKLKAYRASVLKAAVEGRLVPTEAALAKQEQRDYEPASVLLDRILGERRRLWEEAELARLTKAGKPPKDDKWKAKYEQPAAPDPSKLPPLPEGWCWATWSQIGFSQNGRPFPSSEYRDNGVRLLRPGNLFDDGQVKWTEKNTRCLPERWADEYSGHLIGSGEIVMNLTAQSLADDFLGRVCITPVNEWCLLNQRIARLTPILCAPRYLLWMFKSSWFRGFVSSLNTGSLIQHMFTSQLEHFPIPLPPLEEQLRIGDEVERRISVAEGSAAICERSRGRATRLRQAVLKWAFEGKLVDQDPRDEPADVLLARIAAERAAAPSPKTRGRRAKSV